MIGSFRCLCNEGFKISAGKCVDINECETGAHTCTGTGQRCINNATKDPGGYNCGCGPGYLGNKPLRHN